MGLLAHSDYLASLSSAPVRVAWMVAACEGRARLDTALMVHWDQVWIRAMIPLSSAVIFNILTGAAAYLAGIFTRAAIQAVQERRERGRLHHFQNDTLANALYWKGRGELFYHVARKAWQHRMYDGRVEIGYPVATEKYGVEELVGMGVVGLWGYRKKGVDW
jgi:hypothetical protein